MAKPSRRRDEFQDRYGIVTPYLRKREFEDEEEFDYHPDEEDVFGVAEPHQAILRYLKQIRASFGFDVDCRAPSWFDGPFCPIDLWDAKLKNKIVYHDIIKAAEFAIREINAETTKTYEIVEVEKAVLTVNSLSLLTVAVTVAGDTDADAAVRTTIQAIVYEDIDDSLDLEQWRIKPVPVAQVA